MVKPIKRHVKKHSKFSLASNFVVALLVFVFCAYALYGNSDSAIQLSPDGYTREKLGLFFVGTFFIGLLVTLGIMAIIVYVFLHHSEHKTEKNVLKRRAKFK